MGGANSKISKLKAHAATKEHMLNISRMSGYKNSVVAASAGARGVQKVQSHRALRFYDLGIPINILK